MFGNDITIPHLLIFFPLVAGLITFFIKKETSVKAWSLLAVIITFLISLAILYYRNDRALSGLTFNYEWLKYMGASFSVSLDGMGRLLTFLTAFSFPVILIASYRNTYKNAKVFYGLLLLAQAGLMGVFLSSDALLFYFFWELALIPVYFLCSYWGGEKRIAATFKFFIYTFTGSLLLLVGIIYVYLQTGGTPFSEHSFSLQAFHAAILSPAQQNFLFWLFFIAFAVKMPIFPFHTWQPDTYEQAPTSVTMILSGVMVKMGVFGLIRWLLPIFPLAVAKFDNVVIGLSVIGMIYASLIAIKQDDLKRLVAYSSIAHIGLMCAAIFSMQSIAIEGVMIQMFSHGINIIGWWIVIELIERQLGTRKISQLGGLAHKAPVLTILLVIISFANIALPLTNAFVGEMMMFGGLFRFNIWYTAVAGISIVLAAVYTLNMVQKCSYGDVSEKMNKMQAPNLPAQFVLIVLLIVVLVSGVYPAPLFNLTADTLQQLFIK